MPTVHRIFDALCRSRQKCSHVVGRRASSVRFAHDMRSECGQKASVSEMTSPPTLSVNRTAVQWSPVCGRYLVAKGATRGHGLLIEELPFAVGPKCNGPVVCLGCYEIDPDPEEELCTECGWPLCVECAQQADNAHFRLECRELKDARARFFRLPSGSSHCPQLDCIMPLR